MGYVHADIILGNPRREDLKTIKESALVDSGALMLCIPERIRSQLDLKEERVREITTADGRTQKVPYVGPVEISFQDRNCYVGALVLGEEVLLGAVPMEDMDLVIHPAKQTLTVNPEHPNYPHAKVKMGNGKSS